jgi:hypothetical protein
MKPLAAIFTLLAGFFGHEVVAQPEYVFSNPTLLSGSNNQVNALYRFANVKSGVDARVTIKALVNASIQTFDVTSTGYGEAFQPRISVDENSTGYAEFEFVFVLAGTTTPVSQSLVHVTSIDVDGNGDVSEFESYSIANAVVDYDAAGSALDVTQSGGWITGTNIGGIDYPGIDTASTDVMYTVIATSISTFTVRIGAINTTDDDELRYRSLYFKDFDYPNSPLPIQLTSFTASEDHGAVTLKWTTAAEAGADFFSVERSSNSVDWTEIGTVAAVGVSGSPGSYSLTDADPNPGLAYYRLVEHALSGEAAVQGVVSLNTDAQATSVDVFGLQEPVVSVTTDHAGVLTLSVLSIAGELVSTSAIPVEANQALVLPLQLDLPSGYYLLSWSLSDEHGTQKFMAAN